jgi:hypothetical protein
LRFWPFFTDLLKTKMTKQRATRISHASESLNGLCIVWDAYFWRGTKFRELLPSIASGVYSLGVTADCVVLEQMSRWTCLKCDEDGVVRWFKLPYG